MGLKLYCKSSSSISNYNKGCYRRFTMMGMLRFWDDIVWSRCCVIDTDDDIEITEDLDL
jgi:hypothetical protein